MIHRKFNKLKFTRSYVGGSKERELEIFKEVQGTKEDNSEVNWLEYRRVFIQYSDDVLNIILSWKYVTNLFSKVFLVLTAVAMPINPIISIITLSISVAFHLTAQYFKNRERKNLSAYDFSLNVILSAIKNEVGMDFSKN